MSTFTSNYQVRSIIVLTLSMLLLFASQGVSSAQTVTASTLTIVHGLTTENNTEMASDIYLNGAATPIATNMIFGDIIHYGAFESGANITMRVYATGSTPGVDTPYLEDVINIVAGQDSTLSLAFTDPGATTMGGIVTTTNITTLPEDGNSLIDIQHLAGTSGLDIYINETIAFTNMETGVTETIEKLAGSHTITFVPTGQPLLDAIHGPTTFVTAAGSKTIFYGVGDPTVTNGFRVPGRVVNLNVTLAPVPPVEIPVEIPAEVPVEVPTEIPTGDSVVESALPIILTFVFLTGAILTVGGTYAYRRFN